VHPLAVSATAFRVTPKRDPLTVTGDGSLRRLRFHILRRRGWRCSGLPRLLALPAAPPMQASGFPCSCIFRLYRRSIPDATQESDPSAVPMTVSGLPRTAVLRYRRRLSSKFPQNLRLPVPADKLAEFPRFAHLPASPERISGSPRIFFGLWLLRPTWPHIAMALRSFGGAD